MNCKFCQAQIEDDTKVCPACGADLTAEQEQEETAETVVLQEEAADAATLPEKTENQENLQEQPKEKKLHTKLIAIVCSIVLILGLGVGLWYGINGGFTLKDSENFGKDDITAKTVYSADSAAAVEAADVVIAKVGDKTLTNREFQVYYWMEVAGFLQQNGYYLSYMGLDPSLPLSEQTATEDGMTWEQFFIESALNNWHYYQCLLIEAEKNGVTLSEELRANIEQMRSGMELNAAVYGFASADEMLQKDMGAAMTLDAYMDYVEVYYRGLEYFSSLYSSVKPTAEEVENYFNVHGAEVEATYGVNKESGLLVDVRHILVEVKTSGTDAEGKAVSTDEDWANCLADTEKILASWKEGAATEESFALLANTFSTDPGSNTNGGLYTYVYEGQMVKNFNDWCFDPNRQVGDTGIVQTDFGYHIIYFVQGGEGWYRRSEKMLIEQTCTEKLAKLMEADPLKVSYRDIVLCEFGLY